MKKLIIFDLDGTLVDTLIDIKNAVNLALKTYNYPERTTDDVRRFLGNGLAKTLERSLGKKVDQKSFDDMFDILTEYYKIHTDDFTKPYEGIFDLLMQFKKDGYLLSCCTNKIQPAAEKLLNKFFPNAFDIIVGEQAGLQKKPHPDMVNQIIELMGVNKNDCIFIGDTEVDRQTAINAKVDYLIVSYGYRTKEEWLEIDPKQKTLPSIESVYQAVKEL